MAGIFSKPSLSNRVNETIFVAPPRKEVHCGFRRVPPWPRARVFLDEVNTAYPAEGYFTTGYPEADTLLRKPPRYGLPMALGSTEESADWDYGGMGQPWGGDDSYRLMGLGIFGAPQTPMGWAATLGVLTAIGYGVWYFGKFALSGK